MASRNGQPRNGDQNKRAGIYVRISSDPEGLRAGVQRQEEDCRAVCARNGWEVIEPVYADNDVSAYSGKLRKDYTRLLDDVKAGFVDRIVVWHPDRLHRSPRELEDFIVLIEATGATVSSVTAGDFDLSTPEGRLTARITGSVARKESEDKSRRIRRKAAELAKEGKLSGGGTRPFGFEKDRRTVRREEAALVKEAAKRVLAGESLRGIAGDWTARGIKTPESDRQPSGGTWTSGSLKRMLVSARIAGMREHHGVVANENAEWKAIIDRETHERLRARLMSPSRLTSDPGAARRYLLTGFALCGLCGAKLVARPRGDKRRCYVCASPPNFKGCGKIRRLADPVEELVSEAVLIALDSDELTKTLRAKAGEQSSEEADLLSAIKEDEAALEELSRDHYVDRRIGKAEFFAARDRLDERVQDLRKQLARLDRGAMLAQLPTGGAALRKAWEERGLDWRRAVLATVVDRVILHPARKGSNRFDPDKVEIVWRA